MTNAQKELHKRLKIKSVKTMMGRDGMAINCNIFLDNKKVAFYRQDGNGGEGMVDAYPTKVKGKDDWTLNRNKLKEIDSLLKKLPKIKLELSGNEFTPDMDWVVEELVEYSQLEKAMKKAICFGKNEKSNVFGFTFPNSYQMVSWKGISNLNKLSPTVIKSEVAKLKKELKKDEIILNTNLPK